MSFKKVLGVGVWLSWDPSPEGRESLCTRNRRCVDKSDRLYERGDKDEGFITRYEVCDRGDLTERVEIGG